MNPMSMTYHEAVITARHHEATVQRRKAMVDRMREGPRHIVLRLATRRAAAIRQA